MAKKGERGEDARGVQVLLPQDIKISPTSFRITPLCRDVWMPLHLQGMVLPLNTTTEGGKQAF